jgi:hypothetical protein
VPLVRLHVNGVVPPVVVSVALYATLICPLGKEVVVIVKVAGAIVSVRFTVFVCFGLPESCTWNVSGELLTAAVGVPVMAPVEAFNDSPAGRVPLVTDHVNGMVPPVAASVVL